jgi:hypothetical protein
MAESKLLSSTFWVPLVSGTVTAIIGVIIAFIPFATAFMGKSLIVVQLPFIIGGGMCIMGVLVGQKYPIIAQWMIILGSMLGILTWINLILIKLANRTADTAAGKKSYWYLWILPTLLSALNLVMFVTDTKDQGGIPLSWRGRNGLSLLETLWDQDVFWGELWFNVMFALLFAIILLIRFPAQDLTVWKVTPQQIRKIFIGSLAFVLFLPLIMLVSGPVRVDIARNWYETQFAYQITVWPLIAGFMLIFIGSIRVANQTIATKQIPRSIGILLAIFGGLWVYLTLITNFHPHALAHIGMQLFTWLMTVGFPLCILVFAIQRTKKPVARDAKPLKSTVFLGIILVIGGILAVVGLQLWAFYNPVMVFDGDMFSFNLEWSWVMAHWPGWLFSCALMVAIVTGLISFQHRTPRASKGKIATEFVGKKSRSKQIAAMAFLTVLTVPLFTVIAVQWHQDPLLLVNQVGYAPDAPKRVIFQTVTVSSNLPATAPFEVIDDASGEIIFTGALNRSVDRYGHSYMVGEFGELNRTGSYHIRAEIMGKSYRSYSFDIAEDVYAKAIEYALRFFYYQRCNYDVKEVVPGYPGHAACHMSDAEVWDGSSWVTRPLYGGWHDAGDYNKYNSWFQTQWYCAQALAEAAILNPNNRFSSMESLYDSAATDAFDEALWGVYFLVNCVNVEGLQGEDARYLVWETVSGYRHWEDRNARMSYWGPPEKDWTTPRRVDFNEWNSTFVGYHRGYGIAGMLMQAARMIDLFLAAEPDLVLPAWVPSNTTYLRELAGLVYNRYSIQQGSDADDIQSLIGKFFYLEELGISQGNNWAAIDAIVPEVLPMIADKEDYPLWFGWAGYYMLGNLLMHYINFNRTVPGIVQDKIANIQAQHFTELFDEPFRIKHGVVDGENVLFYGAERMTDILTSAWLQALFCRVNSTAGRPELVQAIFDWLCGLNPTGICTIEGVGDYNFPQYHHRYSYAREPSGAVPGAIPNGLALAKPGKGYATRDGVEYSDAAILAAYGDKASTPTWPGNPLYRDGVPSSPNEVWIPHNAMFLRIATVMAL